MEPATDIGKVQSDVKEEIESLKARLDALESHQQNDHLSLIVFSGDWDKVYSAFVIATGAAASGMEVEMFFTFWATSVFKKTQFKEKLKKDWIERAFGVLMPRGAGNLALSQFHFGGIGLKLMKYEMKKKNISSLEDLVQSAVDLGVTLSVCDMSMDIIGIDHNELRIDQIELKKAGVAQFIETASKSKISLYI